MIRTAQVRQDGRGMLTVHVDLNQSAGASIGTRFQWYVNGEPVPGQTAATLPLGLAKQGDRVLAEVIPNNGEIDGAMVTTPVFLVGNAAPLVLNLKFDPPSPRAGDRLSILAEVTDSDRHEVTLSYRWLKNGILIQDGSSFQLAPEELQRGDRIAVEVVPHDGRAEGTTARSEELTIGNGVPHITSTPTFTTEGASLQYLVTAVDPDRDPLTFALRAAPPGMIIDDKTGRLVWTPTPESKGSYRVRVEVSDGHDGMAPQEFDVAVPSSPTASISPIS